MRHRQVGLAGPILVLPGPLRGFLYELLEYSSTTSKDASPPYVEVSLIQELTFNPQGYIRTPAPPETSSVQAI
jgi:hypothetical protein